MKRLLPVLVLLVFAPLAHADEEAARYTRTVDEDGRIALEIAAREFVPEGDGPKVWLVGVIHIADASYYEDVQSLLDLHPEVLYESVMPPGLGRLRTDSAEARVEDTQTRLAFLAQVVRGFEEVPADYTALVAAGRKRDGRLGHLLRRARRDAWDRAIHYEAIPDGWRLRSLGADGAPGGEGEAADLQVASTDEVEEVAGIKRAPFNLQERFASFLGLSYQMHGIDYDRTHWRPSDMGIDEVRRAVKARGGDFERVEEVLAGRGLTGTFIRLYLGVLQAADVLSGGQVKNLVKTLLIRKLGEGPQEPEPNAFMDEAVLGAIIQDRNAVVVEDLKRLLAARPDLPSVAVFYGAGHMPDFERRLAALGYGPGRVRWLRAMEAEPRN